MLKTSQEGYINLIATHWKFTNSKKPNDMISAQWYYTKCQARTENNKWQFQASVWQAIN